MELELILFSRKYPTVLSRHKPDQHMYVFGILFGTNLSKILKDVELWMKVLVCCGDVGTLQR